MLLFKDAESMLNRVIVRMSKVFYMKYIYINRLNVSISSFTSAVGASVFLCPTFLIFLFSEVFFAAFILCFSPFLFSWLPLI